MMDCVFWVSLLTIVTSVVSNPVLNQCIPYNPYQASVSQNNPCNQNARVQNQGNFDGSMLNGLLMSKILDNPSIQTILDPNTKIYNQNGQEITRQVNTVAPPSVINNYFIVPSDFFNVSSNNITTTKSKNSSKDRRKNITNRKNNSRRRINLTKTKAKSNIFNNEQELDIPKDVEFINSPRTNGRTEKREKKRNDAKFARIVQEETKVVEENDENETEPEVKIVRKRKNQTVRRNNKHNIITTPSQIDEELYKEVIESPRVDNKAIARRKKLKKNSNIAEALDTNFQAEIVTQSHDSLTKNTVKSAPITVEPSKWTNLDETDMIIQSKEKTLKKNTEIPVNSPDPTKTNHTTQRVKDNRKTRNPNINNMKKEHISKITPVTDSILNNMYSPHMHPGNNFYNNGNYPFNYEQFYQSFLGTSNTKSKNTRDRKNKNERGKKKSQSKVVEIKLKPKKKEVTLTEEPFKQNELEVATTEIPLTPKQKELLTLEESSKPNKQEAITQQQIQQTILTKKQTNPKNTEFKKIESGKLSSAESLEEEQMNIKKFEKESIEISKESRESVIEIPDKQLNNEKILQIQNEENVKEKLLPKPTHQKESVISNSNLKMPPTFIEDLHEFISPKVEKEEITPSTYTKTGVIKDYYPIFNDETFYLESFEDNRNFYTTDRGFEEQLNRERRKYDRNEHYPRANLENIDKIFSRRDQKYKERNEPKADREKDNLKFKVNPSFEKTDDIEIEQTQQNNKARNHVLENIEDQFQTPPLLENPDFQTRKIEKASLKSVVKDNDHQEPVFVNFFENNFDLSINADKEPIQYSRLVNLDTDAIKFDEIPTTLTPINDRIETVFAKTRVVKYGIAKDEPDDSNSFQPTFESGEDKFYSDGHTTYVLAKSLGHAEDYFW